MRAVLVVGLAQQAQRRLQFDLVLHVEHPQQLFERRPDAFDPAVHPRAVRLDALVANTEPAQREGEHPGREDRFIVGSDLSRLAVVLDGIQQQPQEGDRGLLAQAFELQNTSTAMIDNAENRLRNVRRPSALGQVNAPESQNRTCSADCVHVASRLRKGHTVIAQNLGDECLADADTKAMISTVEQMGYRPATALRRIS